ncbi:uncharacterized protein LOC106066442 [Biomphalaria glabrata]|uniref:Uncharacterized protein LOC106066442 n=1 Tax=Biomphalaria glabrata TaxID=6526 RepID=A0A9W3B4Z0_BIOGL|nr:uncharacterized protein LOC106066442 [Biomphalaria glabrata]XP_055894597.1 uncharacterized protein LOC106066442 [Biomphalaria glabrata]XP_055894598.1 uncharacterized protein LOC106066442 [Biomphalaria glabrata]
MDIDIFLKKFEIEMRELEYPEDKWSFLLSKSFVAEVPSKICMNQSSYSVVKEQLLRTYGKTEAYYREQFVNCAIETNDDPQTFMDRMTSSFENWTETAKIEKTFDGLKTFLMIDKAIYECQEELKIFLLERKPKSIEDIVRLIRAYKVAHPDKKLFRGSDIEEIVAFNRTRDTRDNYINNGRRYRYDEQNRFRGQGRNQMGSRPGQFYSNRGRYQRNVQGRFGGVRDRRDQSLSMLTCAGSLEYFETFVGNKIARTIRDSGSTIVGVNKKLVEEQDYTGKSRNCVMFDGKTVQLPIARIKIDTPYFTGIVDACVIDYAHIDLIIGNIPGIKNCNEKDMGNWKKCFGMSITRSKCKDLDAGDLEKLFQLPDKKKKKEGLLQNSETLELNNVVFDKERFITEQKNDLEMRQLAQKGGRGGKFYIERGILVREIESQGRKIIQVVVPAEFRNIILKNGHDEAYAGHMGIHKTKQRIFRDFYWPSISKDIKNYVLSCKVCQMKGTKKIRAPLQKVDIPERPFSKIAIDLIGPMPVISNRGHRYILTVIDVCSRWPEAIPLKRIEASDIVQALYTLFTRFGFPEEVLSDRGTQFHCQLTTTFLKMFGIRQRFTAPYHPQSNGICERFNCTLKKALSKVADDNPKEWDVALPSILFAYRESRNETTGFSPFQMIYGGNPRGPMTILKELILPQEHVGNKESYDIVTETRNKVIKACEEASKHVLDKSELTQSRVNEHRKLTKLEVGQDVLVLLKDKENVLFTKWLGPYKVTRKISDVDYEIKIDSRLKIFHVDMLKEFRSQQKSEKSSKEDPLVIGASVSVDFETEERLGHIETISTDASQTWKDVEVTGISSEKTKEVTTLLEDFKNIFTDLPGRTNIIEHDIIN